MENWVHAVVEKWKTEGVKINSGASLADIETVERALDFKFPEDFKNFYLAIDGFKDLDWQEHMFYFWPIERIIEEFDESSDKDFIGFCDFFHASNFIGFRKSKKGIYKVYPSINQEETDSIAQTFEQAVAMINSSNDLIY